MMTKSSAWNCTIALSLALSACEGPSDASQGELIDNEGDAGLELSSSALLSVDASQFPVMIGDVIDNAGYTYMLGANDWVTYFGSHNWDTCAEQHTLIGHVFDENGFWLCARPDLASRTFYVGDVELNHGYYYRVTTSGVTKLPSENWNTCVNGSTYLARRFNETGFWVCMSPQ